MSEWINCRNCGTLIENLCACPNCDPVPSEADQAKGPSAKAVTAARAIEADHQFGRQGPQRVHDRALLIDEAAQPLAAALRELLEAEEAWAASSTFEASLPWVHRYNAAKQQAGDALRGWETKP